MSHSTHNKPFVSLQIAVLTVSDTRTLETDTSGQYLVDALIGAGHQLVERHIVKDDVYQLRAIVSAWIASPHVQVILATGGTGFSGRDNTPEALSILFDKHIDGFGEMFRQYSVAEIGTSALQSRALAGMANNTLIFCVPGSTNACKTAWTNILAQQLDNQHRPCNFVPHLKKAELCGSRDA